MRAFPDSYDVDALNGALAGTAFAGRLRHFPSIDSTNTFAIREAQAGAEHGCVYVADEQTAGRGRGAHAWHSRVGDGLYVSVLLRPALDPERVLWLSLAAGMAVKRAVEAAATVKADIRWPNDVLIGGKKCAGILVESSLTAGTARYAVVGMGININHESFPEEIAATATSLRVATGLQFPRSAVLVELLRALEDEAAYLTEGDAVLQRFAQASSWVTGMSVSVPEDEGYTGVTSGLDARGFLRVRDSEGRMRTVRSGGVRPLEG